MCCLKRSFFESCALLSCALAHDGARLFAGVLLILSVSGLFLSGAQKIPSPVPTPAGPTLIITPLKGKSNLFELLRVLPDRVEVRQGDARMQFSRSQIRQIRIPELGDTLTRANQYLGELESEDASQFPELITKLESTLPLVAQLAGRYQWLIPDASRTYVSLNQSYTDMQITLEVMDNLKTVSRRLGDMVNGSLPLSSDWETQLNEALAQTNRIPYQKIRKEVLDPFLEMRRSIRLELIKANEESSARARNLLEDLHSELQAGTLTEAGAQLLLNEIRRHVDRVLEPTEHQELAKALTKAIQTTQDWFTNRILHETSRHAQKVLLALDSDIQQASAFLEVNTLRNRAQEGSQLVALIPDSASKDILVQKLTEIQARIAPEGTSTPLVEGQPQRVKGSQPPTPLAKVEKRGTRRSTGLADFQQMLLKVTTKWWFWAGLTLLLFLVFIYQKRKISQIKQVLVDTNLKHEEEKRKLIIPEPAFPELGKDSDLRRDD